MTPLLPPAGDHLGFQDEVVALRQQVEELQAMGVDQIVALGHSGFAVDQEVAHRVGGVDVVIGGHSNTFLYTGGRGLLFFLLPFLLLGGLTQLSLFANLRLHGYWTAGEELAANS